MFKLSQESGSRGLKCDESGLSLAGVPLLVQGDDGFEPRPSADIEVLLTAAYRTKIDRNDRWRGLWSVARFLNEGSMAKAMIAAVLLRLPELDWDGAVRIAREAERLTKYNPDEPRDAGGRWTTDAPAGATPASRATTASEGVKDHQSVAPNDPLVPVADKQETRTLDECVAECTSLTLDTNKLPPGATGSREWEFHRCMNTCLGIGPPWPQWAPFFPPQRYTPLPPRSAPKIVPKPWWLIPLIPFPGNPLYGGA